MTNSKKKTILVALTMAASFATPIYAADNAIGVNSAIKGDVEIQSGEQAAKQAVVRDPVMLGDVVNSEKLSSLQVLLKDQTTFTVGPDCSLTIDEYVYNPANNTNSMSARVSKGMFRFMSGNISKSGADSVAINTPVASMGIRGTMAEGLIGAEAIDFAKNAGVLAQGANADPVGASLFVLRGPGRNNTSTNTRGEISVTSAGVTKTTDISGMAIFVPDINSPPTDPFRLQPADMQVFNDRLRTVPTSQNSYRPFELWLSSAPGLSGISSGPNWYLAAAGLATGAIALGFASDEDASSP